jgi:hypothetical protein
MTLELSQLTHHVCAMGKTVAERRQTYGPLVELARQWLVDYADQGAMLCHPAREIQAAIPTNEPLDAVHPLPTIPQRFTVVAADGSQIQPDRHAAALYYLINIGSLIYRHGSGEAPEAESTSSLGYTEDELYEDGTLVAGNLLDVRRDLAELSQLADMCTAEQSDLTVALVDGSIVLWVLEDRAGRARSVKVGAYLDQLNRIRRSGAAVGGYISRPGYGEVTRLLHLASIGGSAEQAGRQPNPLEHLPDRALFATLPPGARSALFASPKPIIQEHYRPQGHEVRFFYVNVVQEGRKPAIARVEVPAWLAEDAAKLNLTHAAIVAQARITGDYPYALARADELAYISGRERAAFEEMVDTALLRAGVRPAPSPKATCKRLTRRGF